jgi:hypothetical protein
MKTLIGLIVFVFSILNCGPGFGQNEYITLTSSDFIKGLNNKDFLRQKLTENGFITVTKTGIGITDIKTEKSPEDSKTIKNNTDTKTSKSNADKKAGKIAALAALDESWNFKSMILVDIIYISENDKIIKVAVKDTYSDFYDRLITSFPSKRTNRRKEPPSDDNLKPASKTVSYSLLYTNDKSDVRVYIWYDAPFYFLQYKEEK